jgi:hypothetical protein
MIRLFRAAALGAIALIGMPALVFSQTATHIDFSPQSARAGVLSVLSATLTTSSSTSVSGATIDFQINDAGTWRSIVDDLTTTSNVTDSTGNASVAFLPPDNISPGTYLAAIRAVFSGNGTYVEAYTSLTIQQPTCTDEGVVFNCPGSWEAIRIATHRTSAPGIPLILVHGNGQEDEQNRANYFGWSALRNSILTNDEYAPFDVFIWKHDTARAIGFNGSTGNATDLAAYVNRLMSKYPAGTKLVFIAHSRGGLVVRSFMNYHDQGNSVARLITLGTPHHGTPFAVPDWTALSWNSNVGNDASVFDGVYSFAFDVKRLGSLNMAWDNVDGAINDNLLLNFSSKFAVNGQFILTPADANSTAAAADSTVFYSSSLKLAFGTLADLNQREKYADRIVRYGAYDDSLSDNDDLAKQTLSSLLNAFSLAFDQHKALEVVTSFLARSDVALNTTARYFANDGLVPLQSALYLDFSNATPFSSIDSQKHVSLNQISVSPNCAGGTVVPLGGDGNGHYRVWWGSQDSIQDHLDLIATTNACYWQALSVDVANSVVVPRLTLQYGFPASAGTSATTTGSGATATAGYVRIQPAPGSSGAGFAIYGLTVGGVLVSETAVLASPSVQRGRVYAQTGANTRTGLAVANTNDQDVTVTFYFTDQNGVEVNRNSFVMPAHSQIAKFLDEPPFNGGTFTGSFTFDASAPVVALALRGYLNERSEFLMSTLPVAQLASSSSVPVAIPQFVDGAGWTTSVLLVNSTDSAISGTAEFFTPGTSTAAGHALTMLVNGQRANSFFYNIPPRSSTSLDTDNAFDTAQTGWIKITPVGGSASPVALAVFRFTAGGIVVSETGVLGQPSGSSFNLYVETSASGSDAKIRSGLALANTSANPITVTLDLSTLAGTSTGLTSSVVVPAQGQLARFLTELPGFENLPGPFQGVLKIKSTSAPLSVIGLRGHVNERNTTLLATTPPLNNDAPPSNGEIVIPHFVDGGGYTTQFVLFSGTASDSSGTMIFLDKSGQPLGLTFQ